MSAITINREEPVTPPIKSFTITLCPKAARQLAWLAGNTFGVHKELAEVFRVVSDSSDTRLPDFNGPSQTWSMGGIRLPEELQ